MISAETLTAEKAEALAEIEKRKQEMLRLHERARALVVEIHDWQTKVKTYEELQKKAAGADAGAGDVSGSALADGSGAGADGLHAD